MTEEVIVMGDLHTGGEDAIMSDRAVVNSGKIQRDVPQNEVQEILYGFMKDIRQECGNPDYLVLNGDLCNGTHKKGQGIGNWTNDLTAQVEDCARCVEMFDAPKKYVVGGSFYHVGENLSTDESVANIIGAKYHADNFILRTMEGQGPAIHFCHFIGVSNASWQYRTTPIAKEVMMASLNEKSFGKIDIVMRSHAHYYIEVRSRSHTGINVPAFRGRDHYVGGRSLSYDPEIGCIRIQVEPSGRYNVIPMVYKLKGEELIPVEY